MNQHYTGGRTGITYALQGEHIGVWGQRPLRYLKQHHKFLYCNLLPSGKLNDRLTDIDKRAESMFLRLLKELAEKENVNEQPKSDTQTEWVARMNNIRSKTTKIVNHDIIYNQSKAVAGRLAPLCHSFFLSFF